MPDENNGADFFLHGESGSEIRIFRETDIFKAASEFGEMSFQNFIAGDLTAWHSNYQFHQDVSLTGTADFSIIELHIAHQNHFECSWDGVASASNKKAKQFNISYVPFVNNKAKFLANKKYSTFDVHISKSFLEKYLEAFPFIEMFLNKIEKKIAADISTHDHRCCPAMSELIHHILHSPFNDVTKKSLISHQLAELVIMALSNISEYKQPISKEKNKIIFRDGQEEALHDLKQMIENHEGRIPSLKELSRKYIMNEFKLKEGFKLLFGMNIYEYHLHFKLQRAKYSLLDTNDSLMEIAMDAGYADTGTFIKAFKRKYGSPPGWLRMNGKQ